MLVGGPPLSLKDRMATIISVSVDNFLSLRATRLTLGSLNVLVGPNGAGKTNLLKVFQFLGEVARRDLAPAIEVFGGFDNLVFRGEENRSRRIRIELRGRITRYSGPNSPDEYTLTVWDQAMPSASSGTRRSILRRSERLLLKRTRGAGRRIELTGGSSAFITERPDASQLSDRSNLPVRSASSGLFVLRQLGATYDAEQVSELADVFESLRLFEVDVEAVRRPTDAKRPEVLRPDGSNVAAFLLWMSREAPASFERVCEDIRFVLPGFEEFRFTQLGGSDESVRLDVRETHLRGVTPLGRASYGTIRSIALFAMLHDPNPPQLTCLEEVDHGLHPYALDRLVERLREASERTQILVATHSPALVNRIQPEDLIVFERDENSGETKASKPSRELVARMSEQSGFQLGELWFSGLLGGVL